MITISIDPIIFSIGYFHLRWYSLIVTAAISVLNQSWLTLHYNPPLKWGMREGTFKPYSHC
jgi:prolipoprotein diacylglyceryltransferase